MLVPGEEVGESREVESRKLMHTRRSKVEW